MFHLMKGLPDLGKGITKAKKLLNAELFTRLGLVLFTKHSEWERTFFSVGSERIGKQSIVLFVSLT